MNNRTVAISLGSNIGNRLKNIGDALHSLRLCGFRIKDTSRVWETMPWGETAQPRFLNMCLIAETDMSCDDMLSAIKRIEKKLGRTGTRRWGPREIDIDIILAGNEVYESDKLTIPHRLMQERAFVLRPLAEIAPDMRHPKLDKTVEELSCALPPEEMQWIIKI